MYCPVHQTVGCIDPTRSGMSVKLSPSSQSGSECELSLSSQSGSAATVSSKEAVPPPPAGSTVHSIRYLTKENIARTISLGNRCGTFKSARMTFTIDK